MENERVNRKKTKLIALCLLLAMLLAWFAWRPRPDNGAFVSEGDWVAAWDHADPDDILVDLVDDVSAEEVAAIERRFGIDLKLVSSQSADEQFYRAHVAPERRDEILRDLLSMENVEIAEPDALMSLPFAAEQTRFGTEETKWKGFPNDPKYKFQWHLRQIDMPNAWKLADGNGVVVAVIDTGVAFSDHQGFKLVPDLAGKKFLKPYNFVGNNEIAHDDHGHGTHVAGTIAQDTNNGEGVAGVAPEATIMPLKVLSASGSGSIGAIADAVRYAADEGAHVINMSLGGPFPSKALRAAVEYAHKKGVVVVCAAGNDGRGRLSYPARYPHAFAVAATQYDEATTFYSNWGKGLDIAAPGGNTREDQNGDGMPDGVVQNTIVLGDPANNGYFPYMGTSMAAPHIAGVAALVVQQGITDPAKVQAILQDTSRKPKEKEFASNRYGAGIVHATDAVNVARNKKNGWQLAFGALVGFFVLASAGGRRSSRARFDFSIGTALGAGGLFLFPLFANWFSIPLGLATQNALALSPVEWAVPGVVAGSNPIFASALLPFLFLSLTYGLKSWRTVFAGFAAGVAGAVAVQCGCATILSRVGSICFWFGRDLVSGKRGV